MATSVIYDNTDGRLHKGDKFGNAYYTGVLASGAKSLRFSVPVMVGEDVTGVSFTSGMSFIYQGSNIVPTPNTSDMSVTASKLPNASISFGNSRESITITFENHNWYKLNSSEPITENGYPVIINAYTMTLT